MLALLTSVGCDSALVDERSIAVRITLNGDSFQPSDRILATVWNESGHTIDLDTLGYAPQRLGYFGWFSRYGPGGDLEPDRHRVRINSGKRFTQQVTSEGDGGTFRVRLQLRDPDGDLLPDGLSYTPAFDVAKRSNEDRWD